MQVKWITASAKMDERRTSLLYREWKILQSDALRHTRFRWGNTELGNHCCALTRPIILRRKMNVRTGSRREFVRRVGVVTLLTATTRFASAHAKIVRSEPKDGATVHGSPKKIELWFNELLDDQFNTIEIFSAKEVAQKNRKNLAREKPEVDPKDRTHLTFKAPPLEPGSYAVEYRVLSRDGHSAPGRFTFTVAQS